MDSSGIFEQINSWFLGAVSFAFTAITAWIGKLHVDLMSTREKLNKVERESLSREEFDAKLREYKDESWRAHTAAQKTMTANMNRQFDNVMSSLGRLESRVDGMKRDG